MAKRESKCFVRRVLVCSASQFYLNHLFYSDVIYMNIWPGLLGLISMACCFICWCWLEHCVFSKYWILTFNKIEHAVTNLRMFVKVWSWIRWVYVVFLVAIQWYAMSFGYCVSRTVYTVNYTIIGVIMVRLSFIVCRRHRLNCSFNISDLYRCNCSHIESIMPVCVRRSSRQSW